MSETQGELVAREATIEDVESAWTTRDLAIHFGVPIQTVAKAAQRGSIPGCAKVMGQYIFDKDVALAGWSPSVACVSEPRTSDGRFAKGNSIAAGGRGGRPKRRFELRFLRTLVDTVKPEDWQEIILKAVEQAKEGNHRARVWLSNYLIGVPVQRVLAEVDVAARHSFEDGERAAAIMALLQAVREREESQIIDVTPREVKVDAST